MKAVAAFPCQAATQESTGALAVATKAAAD